MATSRHTCKVHNGVRGSKIDYFIHGRDLRGCGHAKVDPERDFAPHKPIKMTLSLNIDVRFRG